MKIYWSDNYGAVSDSVLGCVAVDTTLEGVKNAYASALKLHFNGMKEDGERVPDDYHLEFALTTQAFEKQPRHTPRRRIMDGIQKIGRELATIV